MEIDPLELARARRKKRDEYLRDHPAVFSWEEVYAALLPHKAKILAAEKREMYPARRASRSRAGRSRARVARSLPPDSD